MNAPDPFLAVAALRRCLARNDYAGASRLIALQAVRDGLDELAGFADRAFQSEAEQAYRESVAAWRAEHEATLRRQAERDVAALVAVLAEGIRQARREAAERGIGRPSDAWVADPVSPEQAAGNWELLELALDEQARERRSAA
jgi:hypothetical protein